MEGVGTLTQLLMEE